MGRRTLPFIEKLEIEDVAAEGKAIGRYHDAVVFVPYAVPGDVVDVQVTKRRKKYFEAAPVTYHRYSDIRTTPFCEYFGTCGGCKWQHLPYDQQLMYKQKQVKDALERIGKVPLPEISPILPSANTRFYRNKLEFTFSNKRWLTREEIASDEKQVFDALGFHVPKIFDKIIDIHTCYLQEEPSNKIRNAIRKFSITHGYPFFDIRKNKGYLRNLIIRTSTTGEVMVILVFYEEDEEKREALMDFIQQSFPEISSLMYIINGKQNDSIADLPVKPYSGRDFITEKMEDLVFNIGPKSFYQTNSQQALQLYQKAREFARLTGKEIVYDLYTGTGTIACFVARDARKVIGIEYIEEAVLDARENARINAMDHASFFAGDIKDMLTPGFMSENGNPDVIITDPPRAGMHKDAVKAIMDSGAKRVVYISCNPATQARDLQLLGEIYQVKAVQPVDMFPHTHHVENIVLLER